MLQLVLRETVIVPLSVGTMGRVPSSQEPHIAKLPICERKGPNEFSASRKQHTKITANVI